MMITAASLRHSPFDPLHLAPRMQDGLKGAGIGLIPRGYRGLVNLRVDLDREPAAQQAVKDATGLDLPTTANTAHSEGKLSVLWLGPDEWLFVVDDPAPDAGPDLKTKLLGMLDGVFAQVVDVSGAQAVIGITGPDAREVLERAVPLDMHPRSFAPGQVKHTLFGRHTGVSLHLKDEQNLDLYCRRSFTEYVWRYLEDCAKGAETTLAVLEDR
jgi:sarcosine oxidase subunit gamma